MKTVDAIKDVKKINEMKHFLMSKSDRDYCLFLFGINTGIRIQELLNLRVHNVKTEKEEISYFLSPLKELNPPVYLNTQVREAIQRCIDEGRLHSEDFLFKSKKTSEAISRQQAYRIINEAAKQAGIEGSVGTHTLRKTFGYHAYRKGIAISLIQKRLQQSSSSETIQYLGLEHRLSIPIILDVNL
ncbi:tyrosine-type recombinase/integrase [Bacillus dakarensis]|uniref:tyrosine-type recombinase/integrase n=1 Tax=Robertmurraya dakarensis TaxID=1926278 RepID=UPI00098091EB|nr:tyrosine-type recombinase/integrase [Bacillus dakarensis]